MANTPIIQPGIDLTVLDCISASDVSQAISAAYFQSNIGGVIHSDSLPDTVVYPDAKRFIADKTVASVSVGDYYYWNGTTWTKLIVFSNAAITNGTITYNKLVVATPYYILQMNGAGTAWEAISIPNALQANSIPVTKLVKPVSGSGQVLYYDGATISFANLGTTWVISQIAAQGLPISKIAPGTARYVLRTNAAGTAAEYAAPGSLFNDYEIPITALETDTSAITATAGVVTLDAETGGPAYYFSITANVTDFNVSNLQDGREINLLVQQDGTGSRTLVWDAAIVWPTATAPTIASAASAKTLVTFKQVNGVTYGWMSGVAGSQSGESAEQAIPIAAGVITVTHGLGQKPRSVRWVLVVDDAGGDLNYADNDEVEMVSAGSDIAGTDDQYPIFSLRADATTLYARRTNGATSINLPNATTGAFAAITEAKWKLKAYYSL